MKRTFSGPESGAGAAYAWEGNKDVGTGRMEVTEASAPGKVMCVFMNMDKMVGRDFEAGLANLKVVVEKPAA